MDGHDVTKRKRVTRIEEELEPGEQETELPPVDLADDPLDDVLAELADQVASFTVFRLPAIGQPGKRTFCASYRADDLAGQGIMEFVAERWGGGRYLISPRGDGGAILRNQSFEIDRSVKPKVEPSEPARDTTKSELVELVREVIRDSRASGNGGGAGTPAEITAAIIQSAASQAAAMMAMLQPIIQQMTANAQPQSMKDFIPLMASALEIGAEARGSGGGDGPAAYLPLVEKFANILDTATRRGTVPGERRPVQPPPKQPETVQVSTNVNEPGWIKGLRPYLPGVLAAATADVPPEMVLDELERTAPRLLDWLAGRDPETWPGEVAAFIPELVPHKAWITRLLDALHEDDEAEELPGVEGGAAN